MKIAKAFALCYLTLSLTFSASAQPSVNDLNLMPFPEKVEVGNMKFRIDTNFCAVIKYKNERVLKAAGRMLNSVSGRTGVFFYKQFPVFHADLINSSVMIDVEREGKTELSEDESYVLEVNNKNIILKAETDIGAIRGLATLAQLIKSDENGYYFPEVKISDKPRFPWRGLLVDVCRHFIPIDVLKRNLDVMAAVKMNVFHWHLTEDQGFRIECKTFPKLHELGSDGLYYTHQEIKDIVSYAADRGIRVIPEFDLPGHATSWLVGYPELASAPGPYTIERNWGIFNPTFDPTNEETYKFLDKFFEEMSTLFPDDYWHIGGDENNGRQWNANPEIQKFMKENKLADNHALQNYFNKKIHTILKKYNKTMVGWYTDEQPDLDKDYVVQSWKGRNSLYESAGNGYRCLLSHGFYIDLVQPTEYHYANDPAPDSSNISPEIEKMILGGEATMWSEYVGPETIDSRIWPKTAAIAERLWSPGSVNNVDDMFRRLDVVSMYLEEYGLMHIQYSDMMLRRLANSNDITILKNFINVVEPIYTYDRKKYRRPKSFHPLTGVADAANPDPVIAREFDNIVNTLMSKNTVNPEKADKVIAFLELWKDNHARLVNIIKLSPVLKSIESLSLDLSECAVVGLQSLDFIKKKQQPDQEWVNRSLEKLKAAETPRAETEISVLKSIKKLVEMANRK